jgi:hypothetical protein
MAGMASRKWRGLESTTKSYAKSVICATSANLRCIIRARMITDVSNDNAFMTPRGLSPVAVPASGQRAAAPPRVA